MNKVASAALSTVSSAIVLVVGTAIVGPTMFKGTYNYLRSINGLSDFDADAWARAITMTIRQKYGIGPVHTNM